jgi:hypothetical protein
MNEPLLFVAQSGEHALTGVSENPANYVAALAKELPNPIELTASAWVPAAHRIRALADLRRILRHAHHQGGWFKVDPGVAANALAMAAHKHGGERYDPEPDRLADGLIKVSKRDRAVITPHGRFPSSAAASVALGITRQAVWKNAHKLAPGWRFADEEG